MRRWIARLATFLTLLAAPLADAQQMPQNLPPKTVLGRLNIGPGPAQTIPFSILSAQLGISTNVVNLAATYNVVADNRTDNSAAIAHAISDANNAGGNVTLVFPVGTTLAPTLSATITGANTWFVCAGGPGDCILKASGNKPIIWNANFGGAFGMGFDNGGSATNIFFSMQFGSFTKFFYPVLGSGIGTFISMDSVNAAQVLVQGAVGAVNCTGAVPLFAINSGNGFTVQNSFINGSCAPGAPVTGRVFMNIGNNIDTVIVQDNFVQVLDGPLILTTATGAGTGDIYFSNNIWDTMNNGFNINAASGSNMTTLDFHDLWLTVLFTKSGTNGDCFLFQGAGNVSVVRITTFLRQCDTSGLYIGLTGPAADWKIDLNIDDANHSNVGGTVGLQIGSGSGTYNNFSVTNSRIFGITHALALGCAIGQVIDHLVFSNNDCQGGTNYNGMIAGTAATFAHTNSKQRGNIGLIDAPVYGVTEGGTNCSVASGTCLDNITGFASTGIVDRTGAGAYSFLAIPLTVANGGTGAAVPNPFMSATAPTISSGFCTSPSIPANNGTAAFTINVGSACAGSTGTLTMPAATTGWICDFHDVTTPASNVVEQTGGSTTTVTLTNYVRTTGVAGNFTSSDVIRAKCMAY